MPGYAEWIEWMPSPPLVPDEAPLDRNHLSRMTLGEQNLEREVLAMFAVQAKDVIERLSSVPANAAELAHKLKGSARSVGAFRLADALEAYEIDLATGIGATATLETVRAEAVRARAAIDAILKRS